MARRCERSPRGQVATEFMGMAVLIVVTVGLLWQSALVGYSMFLASRAADQSAREAAVHIADHSASQASAQGQAAGQQTLPSAWRSGSSVQVSVSGDRAQSRVGVQVPLVVPGWGRFAMTVSGSSAARS